MTQGVGRTHDRTLDLHGSAARGGHSTVPDRGRRDPDHAAPDGQGGADAGRLRPSDYALALGTAYYLLLGGSTLRLITGFRIVDAVIGALVVGIWVWELRHGSDTAELLTVLALLCFEATCALSILPGMSFEPATTMLAYVALFGMARRVLHDPRAQEVLVITLAVLGTFFVVVYLGAWIPQWIVWWGVRGPGLPRLDIALPEIVIYDFQYMVGILVAMLVPAFLAIRRWRPLRLTGAALMAGAALVVFMSGGRSAWLGAVAGTVILLIAHFRTVRVARGPLLVAGATATAILVLGWIAGVEAPLARRLFASSSLDFRLDVWSRAVNEFLHHPLAGEGPGTFANVINTTGVWDRLTNLARGPDSSVVQLLTEGGLLGVIGVATAGAALWVGVRRGRSRFAALGVSGVAVFVVSSLTNDTIFSAQHIVLMILWAALAAPMQQVTVIAAIRGWAGPLVAVATVIALVVVGAGVSATLVAAQLFDVGATAGRAGDVVAAQSAMRAAVRWNPAQGLYWREAGFYDYARGETGAAAGALGKAQALSPGDATIARIAALNDLSAGDYAGALASARLAVHLKGTDPAGYAVLAIVAKAAGQADTEHDALVKLLEVEPWLAAAPTWETIFPTGADLAALESSAQAAIQGNADYREEPQRTWLAAMTGSPEAGNTPGLMAISAFLRCDPEGALAQAKATLAGPAITEWDIVGDLMVFRSLGENELAQKLIERASFVLPGAWGYLANNQMPAADPTVDHREDLRLYELKLAVSHPPMTSVPAGYEALTSWMLDPLPSARRGAPGAAVASCKFPQP